MGSAGSETSALADSVDQSGQHALRRHKATRKRPAEWFPMSSIGTGDALQSTESELLMGDSSATNQNADEAQSQGSSTDPAGGSPNGELKDERVEVVRGVDNEDCVNQGQLCCTEIELPRTFSQNFSTKTMLTID